MEKSLVNWWSIKLVSLVFLIVNTNQIVSTQRNGGEQGSEAGRGYDFMDSRYFLHGTRRNELSGGTCEEFMRINAIKKCCANRDDDCYMIHYDTRCYCDLFCDRSVKNDNSDCCPDADELCAGSSNVHTPAPPQTTQPLPVPTTTETPEVTMCFHDGNYVQEGEVVKDNCNDCKCVSGKLECIQDSCLINTKLMNQINNENLPWKAGNYSFFWGKPLDYGYKHRLGTKLPREEQRPLQIENRPAIEFYDYRNEDFMINNPRRNLIRDQGNCGASWAFSTIDVASDRLAKVYEGKNGNETASVQMLISCAILPKNEDGCSPAQVDVAWKWLESKSQFNDGKVFSGVVNEKCYPYSSGETGVAGNCHMYHGHPCPSDNKLYNKQYLTSSSAYPVKVESQNDIMEEILRNGPVQVVFKVYEDFFMYKSGIYTRHPEAKLANVQEPYHSVRVIGWGTENDVDYWIAANSWGKHWGEDGFFRIKRNDETTGFGHNVYAAWASRPINTKNKVNNKRYKNMQRRE